MTKTRLHYTGGGEYIPGIPAGDLNDEDLDAVGRLYKLSPDEVIDALIARGLYVRVASGSMKSATKPDMKAAGGAMIGETSSTEESLSNIGAEGE